MIGDNILGVVNLFGSQLLILLPCTHFKQAIIIVRYIQMLICDIVSST